MDATKANAIEQLSLAGLHIDAISDTDREYAGNAGIRLAKLVRVLCGDRANSSRFKASFGELRRFINQLKAKRETP